MSDHAHSNEETRRLSTKHSTPAWLPISILIGTSLAIGIPVLMFRQARATALKMALENPSAAPPRRAAYSPTPLQSTATPSSSAKSTRRIRMRPLPKPTTTSSSSPSHELKSSSSEWDSSPSLLTALSKANASSAMLGAKAFLIATTLVGIGAYGLVHTVQSITGTYTVPDFARRMRYWTNKYFHGITGRIHRGPENDEERKTSLEVAPFGVGAADTWTWEEAEERLKKAYEQGGFTLWAQVALRELEAEARVERAKRQREIEAETQSRSQT